MGDRERYAPGLFSWAVLETADAEAAGDFYGEVLDWDLEEDAFTLDEKRVAGVRAGEEARWTSYVTVEDVEATVTRAAELGGVAEGGAARDPTGATLHFHAGDGAERVNDAGCMVWNELATPDGERARAFYAELLDWSAETDDSGYATIKQGDQLNGGIRPAQDGEPPHWLVYFSTEELDEATEAATEAGGKVVAGPFDLALGRIAVLEDPGGATFALFEGDTDP
jgi:predicted enzyme related to lactoylglutathione lyase